MAVEIERETALTTDSGLVLLTPQQAVAWLAQEMPTVCLRCGMCCFQYEVDGVPGYGKEVKPICRECRHQESARLEGGIWLLSGCRIHSRRPEVCAAYQGNISPLAYASRDRDGNLVFELPCAQGLKYWTRLVRLYGGQLPADVARFFPAAVGHKKRQA